jgi:hypothetical protein
MLCAKVGTFANGKIKRERQFHSDSISILVYCGSKECENIECPPIPGTEPFICQYSLTPSIPFGTIIA